MYSVTILSSDIIKSQLEQQEAKIEKLKLECEENELVIKKLLRKQRRRNSKAMKQ
jgi:hypothetical protein